MSTGKKRPGRPSGKNNGKPPGDGLGTWGYKVRQGKKRDFVKHFRECGSIREAAKKVEIHRATFYKWFEKDEKFRQEFETIREEMIDLAETYLLKQIKQGNTAATIFFLKCQGKHRGYVERQEVTGAGGSAVQIEEIKKRNDLADEILRDPETRALAREILGKVAGGRPVQSGDDSDPLSGRDGMVRH